MSSASQPAADASRLRASSELAVVHLVRAGNGLEPLARFLESYRRHPAGAGHDLVLLLKGFASDEDAAPHLELAAGLGAQSLALPDTGFDLGSYRRAAQALSHRRLALLNSFSVILADGWLARLQAAFEMPGAAAAGASGSWGSHVSHMRYENGLGGPYAAVFDDRAQTHAVFAALAGDDPGVPSSPSLLSRAHSGAVIARQLLGFAEFPAAHLRTNGLLVEREAWLRACARAPRDKLAAHRMESGRRGISARLRRDGELLLAGREGVFTTSEWASSNTFWQADQGNLLIGDNQTLAYARGDRRTRRVLSGYAWGRSAAPAGPRVAESV